MIEGVSIGKRKEGMRRVENRDMYKAHKKKAQKGKGEIDI